MVSGRGRVYSWAVTYTRTQSDPGPAEPHVLVLVQLAEGPRILSNLVECVVDKVRADLPVELAWVESKDAGPRPVFQPTDASHPKG